MQKVALPLDQCANRGEAQHGDERMNTTGHLGGVGSDLSIPAKDAIPHRSDYSRLGSWCCQQIVGMLSHVATYCYRMTTRVVLRFSWRPDGGSKSLCASGCVQLLEALGARMSWREMALMATYMTHTVQMDASFLATWTTYH